MIEIKSFPCILHYLSKTQLFLHEIGSSGVVEAYQSDDETIRRLLSLEGHKREPADPMSGNARKAIRRTILNGGVVAVIDSPDIMERMSETYRRCCANGSDVLERATRDFRRLSGKNECLVISLVSPVP